MLNMNKNTFDDWSITHFLIPFFFGYIFLVGFAFPLFIVYGLVIFFELFEHLLMGDLVFRWKTRKKRELPRNAIADIMIGLFAVFLASIMQQIL